VFRLHESNNIHPLLQLAFGWPPPSSSCFLCVVAESADNPHAGAYTGTVFGATDNRKFVQLVRINGLSIVVYFDGFDETGGAKDGISVDNNGNFVFQISSAPSDTATGQIVGYSVSGSICCAEPGQFSGNQSPSTGFLTDYGGIYRGTVTGTSTEDGQTYQVNGAVVAIVEAIGNVMMYIPVTLSLGRQTVEAAETGGMISINSSYVVSGILLDGVQITGTFTPVTLTATGQFRFSEPGTTSAESWTMVRQEGLPPVGLNPGTVLPGILPLLLNSD
jgi:hypothetical protein